jgi:hypothetical protein
VGGWREDGGWREENEGRGRVVRSTALDEVVTRAKCTGCVETEKIGTAEKKDSNSQTHTHKKPAISSRFNFNEQH